MNNKYSEAIGRCLDEIYRSDKYFPDIPLRHGDNIRAALEDLVAEVSGEAMRSRNALDDSEEDIGALKNTLRELCEKMEAGVSGPEETKRARALLNG